MRSVFCGNFDYDARQSDLERLFRRYGKVERVDMKSGYAFIYMVDDRDAEDAIRALDQIQFGRKGCKIRVEWTKEERINRRPESSRRYSSNLRPSKTLFVINFDPYHTRTRDLERHFDPYGKILNVRIRRNFAFIQYESQEDATRALDATNMSQLLGRVISVEYSSRDDDERRSGYSPPSRVHERSPRTMWNYEHVRSPSPHKRGWVNPYYEHGRREWKRQEHAQTSIQSPTKKEWDLEHDGSAGSSCKEHERHEYGRTCSPSPVTKERDPEHGSGQNPVKKETDCVPHHKEGCPSPAKKDKDYELGGSCSSSPNCRESESAHISNQSSPKKEKDPEVYQERCSKNANGNTPCPQTELGEENDMNPMPR